MKVWHTADKVEKLMFTFTLTQNQGPSSPHNAMQCVRGVLIVEDPSPRCEVGPNDAGRKYKQRT